MSESIDNRFEEEQVQLFESMFSYVPESLQQARFGTFAEVKKELSEKTYFLDFSNFELKKNEFSDLKFSSLNENISFDWIIGYLGKASPTKELLGYHIHHTRYFTIGQPIATVVSGLELFDNPVDSQVLLLSDSYSKKPFARKDLFERRKKL